MIRPASLQKGDTVAIVAPSRKIAEEDVRHATDVLKSWGVNVTVAKNIFSKKHAYLAGTDQERLEDFQTSINDSAVRAIICARGGYGATRLVDQLDFSVFQKNPKWIVGFSDITAIHLKVFGLGYESIHGIMPVLFSKPDAHDSLESLRKVLFGQEGSLITKNSSSNRKGEMSGQAIGGNLSLIVDSLGTQSEPDLHKKILIVEEIDEYFYKIDRMFTQLKRSGKLGALAGLVIGHFTNIKDSTLGFGQSVEEIILNASHEYDYPVGFGFKTGHENPNIAWRHGGTASLVVNDSGARLDFTAQKDPI